LKPVSKTLFGISIIISLLVGAVGGYFTYPMLVPTAPKFRLPSEVPIGYIHSTPVQIPLAKFAIQLFVEDINKYTSELGIPVTFVVWEENAEESATRAHERAETLLGRGVQVLVGPAWSSHAKSILPLVNERKIPVISCCSSSTDLAIPNDYLFRIAPDTNAQALVLRRMFLDMNIKAVIPVNVVEDYSVNLLAAMQKALPSSIEVYESTPLSPEKKEFIGEFSSVEAQYKEALNKYKASEIVIPIISADGGAVYAPILNSMANYPVLMDATQRVFGGDVGGATGLIEYASEAASKVQFTAFSAAAAVASPNYQAWAQRFKTIAGFDPEYHGFNSYDALWIAALAILQAPEYTGESIAQAIPDVAAHYYGVSGWTALNPAGDRQYPMFTVYRVIDGKWQVVGIYDGSSDTVVPVGS
jgi:branched-chain amino acid transport system substrate-binding protein